MYDSQVGPNLGGRTSAYDAAYVAVAEDRGVPLVTDDDQIVATAPQIAVALADFSV